MEVKLHLFNGAQLTNIKKKKKVDFLKTSSCHKIFGEIGLIYLVPNIVKKKKQTNKQTKKQDKTTTTTTTTKNTKCFWLYQIWDNYVKKCIFGQ